MKPIARTHRRSNAIHFAMTIVLVSLLLGTFMGGGGVFDENISQREPFFEGLDVDAVVRVLISSMSDDIEVVRSDSGEWTLPTLDGALADEAQIKAALDEIQQLPLGRVASSDTLDLDRYGLDVLTRLHVQLFDSSGETLVSFYAGKQGAGSSTTFVMNEGGDSVRRIPKRIRSAFNREGGIVAWRDLKVFDIGDHSLNRIRVEGQDETVVLDYINAHWSLSEPIQSPLEPWAGDLIRTALSPLKATRWITDAPSHSEIGLDPPRHRIEITLDNGTVWRCDLGEKTSGGRDQYASVVGEPAVFLFPHWVASDLTRTSSQWLTSKLKEDERGEGP